MRKIIFDLVTNNTGKVMYPDDIAYFANTHLLTDEQKIIADYSGNLELPGYVDTPNFGRIISVAAWRKRYTIEEKATIDLLSIDDPSANNAVRLQQATIRQVLKELDVATEVPLDDPEFQTATLATCELLKTAGLITDATARFNELVFAPVEFAELPERLKLSYSK